MLRESSRILSPPRKIPEEGSSVTGPVLEDGSSPQQLSVTFAHSCSLNGAVSEVTET